MGTRVIGGSDSRSAPVQQMESLMTFIQLLLLLFQSIIILQSIGICSLEWGHMAKPKVTSLSLFLVCVCLCVSNAMLFLTETK